MLIIHFLSFLPLAQMDYYHVSSAYQHGSSGYMPAYDTYTLFGLGLLVLMGIFGSVVQSRMMSRMRQYSAEPARLSGAQVARKMLDSYGLYDVEITHVRGQLTDHYNPANRTVNLSDTVYSEASVAAAAVAAHECGHAVQHAKAYPWLGLRSSLVPLVNIGSRLGQLLLIVGLALAAAGSGTTVAWVGLALFGCTTLFALVTLPVEFDASRRALAWLSKSDEVSPVMHAHATSALRWAAMTYVAAALSSIAMLLYYALMLLNRGNSRD